MLYELQDLHVSSPHILQYLELFRRQCTDDTNPAIYWHPAATKRSLKIINGNEMDRKQHCTEQKNQFEINAQERECRKTTTGPDDKHAQAFPRLD